jgi:hypothetical protein
MDQGFFLRQLLSQCDYEEDLAAARHFVFHPRRNLASNLCLICERPASGGLLQYGHSRACAYAVTFTRVRGSKLSKYVARK